MRSVPEWIGATPDAAIPARVRLRVFEAHGGICALTGRKIRAGDRWQCDHRIPLVLDPAGHRESNLQPVLEEAHRAKTAEDVAVKAKVARVRKKNLGLHRPKSIIPGSKASGLRKRLDGTVERRKP